MGVAGFSESLGLHTIYVFVSEGTWHLFLFGQSYSPHAATTHVY